MPKRIVRYHYTYKGHEHLKIDFFLVEPTEDIENLEALRYAYRIRVYRQEDKTFRREAGDHTNIFNYLGDRDITSDTLENALLRTVEELVKYHSDMTANLEEFRQQILDARSERYKSVKPLKRKNSERT